MPADLSQLTRRDFLKLGGTGLVGASLLGVAGCGVFEQGGGGGSANSIVINLEETIRDLNSTSTTDNVSTEILYNVMDGLFRLDENTQPVPAQAEKVEISEDGLDYTFTLRDGLKWSNGDPVTSQDFKYAWLRALDPDTAGQYAYIIYQFVKGAEEFNAGDGSADDVAIDAPDDKTLKATLVRPAPFWLGLMAFHTYLPQNQKFVESKGDQYAQNAEGLIYNGPYLLTEVNPTSGFNVVKNEDYWDAGRVDIKKIEGKIVKELETAVNLYESGGLDLTEINSEYVTQFKGQPDYYSQTYFATAYVVGNHDKQPIFENKNIRKAFQLGFDRETVANKILNDGSTAATGLIPTGMAGPGNQTFREAEGPTAPAYDPAQAKEFFQKGIDEVGENPEIELLAYDDSVSRDVATLLQSEWEKMGAKINVKVQPFDRKLELEANGDFGLSWQAWLGDYDDPMTFLELFETGNAYNTGKYSNKRYDELIRGAREEADVAKRMDMLLEAEKLLVAEDAGTAPFYFYGMAFLKRPALTNFIDQPYGAGKDYSYWRLKG